MTIETPKIITNTNYNQKKLPPIPEVQDGNFFQRGNLLIPKKYSNLVPIKSDKFSKVKPVAKKVGRGGLSFAMRVIPGIIMMTCSFTLGHMLNKPTSQPTSSTSNCSPTSELLYKLGEQHARDSIKISNLEKKIATDSIKFLKK